MEQHNWKSMIVMNTKLIEIRTEQSWNLHHFCKILSQKKRIVFQSTAPSQLKHFEVGCWVGVVASSLLHPVQEKTPLPNRPIHWLTPYIYILCQATCFSFTGPFSNNTYVNVSVYKQKNLHTDLTRDQTQDPLYERESLTTRYLHG
jgi:hypothetical protein